MQPKMTTSERGVYRVNGLMMVVACHTSAVACARCCGMRLGRKMTSGSKLYQTKQDVTSYPANKATSVLLDAPCAGPDEIDDGILSRDTGPLIRRDTVRAALFAQIGIGERDHNPMLGRGSYRAIFNTIAAFPGGLVPVIDP